MDPIRPNEHAAGRFPRELEAIRSRVLQMGGMVEEQLGKAIRALVTSDQVLARSIVQNDVRVNAMEVEIDEECTRFMARGQPDAPDLRLVMAVMKTITDLERIGDEVKRVGKMIHEEMDGALDEEVRYELEHMGGMVKVMLRDVLDAFARIDVDSAIKVARADDKVDARYRDITRQLMTHMAEDGSVIPAMMNVLWAVRAMERMGDRCQNIAEYVIYLALGRDVRHVSVDDLVNELETG